MRSVLSLHVAQLFDSVLRRFQPDHKSFQHLRRQIDQPYGSADEAVGHLLGLGNVADRGHLTDLERRLSTTAKSPAAEARPRLRFLSHLRFS